MNRLKKIIILGASELQLPAIKQAKKMGLYVISVDFNEKAVGFNFCDKKYVISTLDKEAVLKIAKEEEISGIMTLASDLPMRTVAYVSEKLGLPGISRKTAEIVTNKYLMRKVFSDNKIQTIQYKLITNFEELQDFKENTSANLVLKPISSSGSRGVSFIDRNASNEILLNTFERCQQFSNTREMIVEEFFSGYEVSVESITISGKTEIIQVTDKYTTGKPYFVEIGHSQPANIDEETEKKIVNLVKKAVQAVGLLNGPAHTEIIIDNDILNIVEIGARLGGDYITTDLVPLSTGINMVEKVIQLSIGDKVEFQSKMKNGSAIRFFQLNSGTIRKVSGKNKIDKLSDITRFNFELQAGDVVEAISNSTTRYGFVIAKGKSSKDAVKKCNEAIKLLDIKFE